MNLPFEIDRRNDLPYAVQQLTHIYSELAIRVVDLEKRVQELEALPQQRMTTAISSGRADA